MLAWVKHQISPRKEGAVLMPSPTEKNQAYIDLPSSALCCFKSQSLQGPNSPTEFLLVAAFLGWIPLPKCSATSWCHRVGEQGRWWFVCQRPVHPDSFRRINLTGYPTAACSIETTIMSQTLAAQLRTCSVQLWTSLKTSHSPTTMW